MWNKNAFHIGLSVLLLESVLVPASIFCFTSNSSTNPRDDRPDFAYEIEGLDGPARIQRDSEGIAHIISRTDRDAYFALGYVHARDRLFQMDYSRYLFSGTLAELLGESQLDSDIQFRTLGCIDIICHILTACDHHNFAAAANQSFSEVTTDNFVENGRT